MKSRWVVIAALVLMAAFGFWSVAPAGAKVGDTNGRIVFSRFDRILGDTVTYVTNADGSRERRLFPGASEAPHWSPDGSSVALLSACTDGEEDCAVTIVDPETGAFRQLKMPDPTLFTGCPVWSADGALLACESFGEDDPGRNGVYTIRASDGGGLTRLTSNPGGDDIPIDFSPDGSRLLFLRFDPDGNSALYVLTLADDSIQNISPSALTDFMPGSWSPEGNEIVFAARTAPGQRRSIWIVRADGSGLHQVPISPACGGAAVDRTSRGCLDPVWSPDGTRIAFAILDLGPVEAANEKHIFTVDRDGTDLAQITVSRRGGGDGDQVPDWGALPAAGA